MLRGFFNATTVFTGIIELLPDDLKLVMCNQRMAELYGYSVDEMLTLRLSDLPFSEALRQSRLELYRSCWETGKPLTTEYSLPLRGQDYYFQESISPIRDSNSGRSLLSFAAVDITDRRRAEDELRRLNTELEQRVHERTVELQRERNLSQTILDSMGEGVIYSEDGTIHYVNRALGTLTDYAAQELIGSPDGIFLGRDHIDQQGITAVYSLSGLVSEAEMTWRGERAFFRKNGSNFNAALTVSRLINVSRIDNPGSKSGIIVLVRDISEEKQLEAQKSRFIADASHELRTPLTNITTRLYLLRKQPEQSETHLSALDNAVNRATELVEDLLDINRFERGAVHLKRQQTLLQDLVMLAVQSQLPEAAAKNILLGTDMPTEAIFVLVDPNRFLQVIVNLLTNAINYTPGGGRVTVELGVEAVETRQYAVLRVRDNGIGIPPEHLPHISEPFYRVDHSARRGTGLGLSIAKEIIDLHKASLIIESAVGVGSTFGVMLPVVS